MFEIILAIFVLLSSVYIYLHLNCVYSYWSVQGVNGPRPHYLLGNLIARSRVSAGEFEISNAKQFGKLYGTFIGTSPCLVVLDRSLIKQVLIRDFASFINRFNVKGVHEMFEQNLLFLLDGNWKRVRTITGLNFTSARLKSMHPLMGQCVHKLTVHLDKMLLVQNGIHGGTLVDIKQTITGFTMDVVAATMFGTETDANQRDKDNAFVQNGLKMFELNPLRIGAIVLLPQTLLRLFNVQSFVDPKILEYFIDYLRHVIQQRRKGSMAPRNDLIQLLLDARADEAQLNNQSYAQLTANADRQNDTTKSNSAQIGFKKGSNLKSLSDTEMIAQCLVFFSAGFETTESTLTHCLFELAHDAQIQQRLHHEIVTRLANMDTNSSEYYETLMNGGLPYLDAVIKETLRKYPPIPRLNRIVKADQYNLAGIVLQRDVLVDIPIVALHNCEEYFPCPQQFNPDRFLPENVYHILPFTYMPFGDGPRNCMGIRFAYQEIKLCLVQLIMRFQFCATERTPDKLNFKIGSPLFNSHSFVLKVSHR